MLLEALCQHAESVRCNHAEYTTFELALGIPFLHCVTDVQHHSRSCLTRDPWMH